VDGSLQVNNQEQVFTLTDVFRSRRREPGPVLLLDLRSINAPGCELFLEQRTGTDRPALLNLRPSSYDEYDDDDTNNNNRVKQSHYRPGVA